MNGRIERRIERRCGRVFSVGSGRIGWRRKKKTQEEWRQPYGTSNRGNVIEYGTPNTGPRHNLGKEYTYGVDSSYEGSKR